MTKLQVIVEIRVRWYMVKHWPTSFFTALCLLVLASFSVPSNAADGEDPDHRLQVLNSQMIALEERIEAGPLGELAVRSLRQSVQDVLDQTSDIRHSTATEVARLKRLVTSLGLPPEDDGDEDPLTGAERKELSAKLLRHEGQIKRMDLIIARAEQALSDLANSSRQQFRQYLLKQGPSPLSVMSWHTAMPEFLELFYQSWVVAPSRWFTSLLHNSDRATKSRYYLIVLILVEVVGWPLSRWILARYGRRPDISEPGYARRLLAAFAEAVGYGLIPLLFVLGVRILFVNETMLGNELRVVADALTRYLAIFFAGYGLIKAAFTPDSPGWRLTPLRTGASRRVVQRLLGILVIYVIIGGIGQSLTWSTPSDALKAVYGLVFAVALYLAFWALLRHRVWLTGGAAAAGAAGGAALEPTLQDGSIRKPSLFWARSRTLASIILFAIPAAAIAGYARLSGFLIDAAMLSGLVIAGFLALRWLVHSALSELIEQRLAGNAHAGDAANMADAANAGDAGGILPIFLTRDPDGENPVQLAFWAYLVIDAVLLMVALLVLLSLWGLHTETLLNSLARLFTGIQVGNYTFSLLDFTFALVFFAAILLVTHLVQRGLERHFLPRVVRDVGVRNALRTAVGYVGIIIAALVGISTLGLDLSSLALIAGALSVGLGFGLQNIVSNFVSGLILLVERPIKPGDWIVVNGNEGTVKKVNVRSTEIETFQRASVIVPNADLIASPVTNWTHKNVLGRLEVRVGVAYGSDIELVRDTLLEIASAHPMVMATPPPAVVFRDFGASSLDFELRCFLRDVGWVVIVGSEFRFEINERFRKLGIDIPFPQQVVHFANNLPQSVQEPTPEPVRKTTGASRKSPAGQAELPPDSGSNPDADSE